MVAKNTLPTKDGKKDEYKRVGENLYIRVITGRYYAIIKKNYRQARKSLRTSNRSIAEARLANYLTKVNAVTLDPDRKNIPLFADAVSHVVSAAKADGLRERSAESLEGHLNIASKSILGTVKVSHVRKEQVRDFLRNRHKETTGRTANLALIHLRRFFKFALQSGWRWDDPTEGIEPFPHRPQERYIPTAVEIQKVIHFLREYRSDTKQAADFIEFLALSGLRVQGAQSIEWEDVDFEKGIMTVTEKGQKKRVVDLFPALRRFLETRRKDHGLLFPPSGYYPKKALATACKMCAIKRFSFHCLRHFFATECLATGISPSTVSGWLGHSDNGILVMRLYGNHLKRSHFQKEAKRVTIQFSNLQK